MKYFFLLPSLLFFTAIYSQKTQKQIATINTVAQAEALIKTHPNLEGMIYTVSPKTDTDSVFSAKFKELQVGDIISDVEHVYKVLETRAIKVFRVSNIYLDGKIMTLSAIEKLRKDLISQYQKGVPFADLAWRYTMEPSDNGDLHWFSEGTMVPEFEEAVKRHQKGDIFTVDIPERKWYYVTLKTFDDAEVPECTVLQVSKE